MEKVAENIEIFRGAHGLTGARYIAVKLLNRAERSDAYIDKLLKYELAHNDLDPRDKGLLTELVNGVVRWKIKLDWALNGFYHGDYQKCLNIVKNAMRVGLYQLQFLNKIPAYSAINESVEIVKRIQGEKTANIVNGVLRNLARNLDNIRYPDPDDLVYYYSVIYSHPKWMVKRWIMQFGPEETEQLLIRNNYKPLIPIRVNTNRAAAEEIKSMFESEELKVYNNRFFPDSFYVKNPRFDIASSDIFKNGLITIQDPGASLAAFLTAPEQGDFIIDLCAAPGGKSFYMAQLMKDTGQILALDKYESKLRQIREGADRLGFSSIETIAGDAAEFDPGKPADIVLADVPCSGLGTLSKKPDIKWTRDADDLPKITNLQKNIVRNAIKLIKPGGVLVYSTCTIEPEENTEMIKWILDSYPELTLDPAENFLPEDVCKDGFLQVFPHTHSMDGTFAARLKKRL
ncbi:MAG: 16S rRNA (cytosine(967)-C(5))-methyltransferase RsmB [Candidatus Kapaibacterium sp.]